MKISHRLLGTLVSLCMACPKGAYAAKCPFQKLQGITPQSRRALLAGMDPEKVGPLFDLATGCSCPADPRRR